MAEASSEQRELQLVESVEFKILAVANQEDKLQQLLQRYLAPLVLKAGSSHHSVRARVMRFLLGSFGTFIKQPQYGTSIPHVDESNAHKFHRIVLPVGALLDQYKSNDSNFVKQLDLRFIDHSLWRLSSDDRREIIPKVLRGVAGDEGQPRASLFFIMILRLSLDLHIPPRGSKDDEAFRTEIGLSDEVDSKYLAKAFCLFFRLRTPSADQTWVQANSTFSEEEATLLSLNWPEPIHSVLTMAAIKIKLVIFLASGAFTDNEKFMPALYAASNFDSRIADPAEEIVKRSSVSLEDHAFVTGLFQAHSRLPAAYRTRILGLLSRSEASTTMSDSIMAVVTLDFTSSQTSQGPRQALHPSSALERTKLHKALFQYLSWIARIGSSKKEFTIGPQLIKSMMSYIESQGWPSPQELSQDDMNLRSKAYETIGMLCRNADLPMPFRVSLGAWLFRSLSEDSSHDAVVNIDGALSSLSANIPPSIGGATPMLKEMLLLYMTQPVEPPMVRSTRHAAVKWANQCLPFNDVHGRWIDILAIGGQLNERSDVIEQGQRGLDPWTYLAHSDSGASMPDWKDMVTTIFTSLITPDSLTGSGSVSKTHPMTHEMFFQNFQGDRVAAFTTALRYCKQLLFLSALPHFKLEPNWMQTLDARVTTDISTRQEIRSYLQHEDGAYEIFYLRACLSGALAENSLITEECIRCFVDVASLCPGAVVGSLTNFAVELLPLIQANNREIRTLGAKALGVLAAHPSNESDRVEDWLRILQSNFKNAKTAVGPQLNGAEGSLVAFGYLCSRSVYYDRPLPSTPSYPLHLLVEEGVTSSLYDAALESFSQLWSAGLGLPTPEGDSSVTAVIEKLAKEAKTGNEKAIRALGRLAMGLDEGETSDNPMAGGDGWSHGTLGIIMKKLFALHEIKRVEVHFTVGEAITAATARWDSDCVKLAMDVDSTGTKFQSQSRAERITAVLNKLLNDCKATKPSLLKASGIWLFCMVQYCSHLNEVQSRLREAQAAFMRLLSARDELVQETASRGLSLVYERGDSDLKSTLVKDLVSAFTGSGTQLKVDNETELFEPGALPTGEGNSVTSYKDIVNLANEVGDQRLVYRFMSLAANAATWSTRSAFGRFGLSNILSDSEVDPKLYPKLYRYRFDPNTNVQRSMDDIWKALVKDSGTVVDTHFASIIEDLLKSILGREWRMRQASCAALSDLLQGRPFTQYETYYREIWTSALKVLDDVKGSVREAALRLCMALSKNLVRQLEEGNSGSAAKAMMKEAVPFLLSDKGAESSVQDVQLFATSTVLEIAKKGGVALRPFIAEMVPQLLGLLSTIEPEQINYIYQRAGEESRDQIDKVRSQMVSQSPISEAIENCLRFVNAEVMGDLAPRLEATIKTAIGMPTKIGCSRVLTTLFTRHANDIKPVSDRLLQVMEKQTLDKNDEVSQAYARAAAYILRTVADDTKRRFCQRFVSMYLAAEEESRRQKIADVIVALAKVSPDHFTVQETILLPLAYLGSHDVDEYAGKIFKEVWNQHAGSSRTVVRYVPEIVTLIERSLDTTQWALRHTGAFAIAALVSDIASASDATGEISEANLKTVWPVFDNCLALKTFPGKEKLLESLPKFVEKGKSLWAGDAQIGAQMKKIAIREAKRNNDEYRIHAFRYLWEFAKARDDLDMLQEIADIVTPYLDELKDEDKMEVDSKEDFASKTARNGLEAVARGYSRSRMNNVPDEVFKILEPYLPSTKFHSIKREVWYECVKDLMSDAAKAQKQDATPSPSTEPSQVWVSYLRSLDMDTPEAGTEPQRMKRVGAVKATLKAKEKGVFGSSDGGMDGLKDMVATALREERALEVQKAWREVLELV